MSVQKNKKLTIIPINTYFTKIGELYHFKTFDLDSSIDAEVVENSEEMFEDVDVLEFLKEMLVEKIHEKMESVLNELHNKFFSNMNKDQFNELAFKMYGKVLYPEMIKEKWTSMLFKKANLSASFDEGILIDYLIKEYYKC